MRKDGEARIMAFSSFVVADRDRHGCIATDVTGQKRLERENLEARESLQAVLDFLPVPLFIVDAEQATLIYASRSAMELFKMPSLKVGVSVGMFMPTEQPGGIERVYGGTGQGLAIAKKLVTLMGGKYVPNRNLSGGKMR